MFGSIGELGGAVKELAMGDGLRSIAALNERGSQASRIAGKGRGAGRISRQGNGPQAGSKIHPKRVVLRF